MARNTSLHTYRRGAVVLIPLVVCVGIALRLGLRAERLSELRDAQSELWRERAEAADAVRKQVELDALAEQARSRAAAAPQARFVSKAPTLATGQHWPGALAADKTHVYWLNETSGEVMRARKDGGAPEVLASKQLLDLPRHATALALDDEAVYWLTSGSAAAKRTDGAVMRLPKTGGEPQVLASSQTHPLALAVAGGAVYWIDGPGEAEPGMEAPPGAVMRLAKPGGKPENLSTAAQPCGLAVDDRHVFWIERDARTLTINKTPKAGGDTEAIVQSVGRLGCSVAVDAGHVYWIDTSRDAILRATKSGDDVTAIVAEKSRMSAFVLDKSFVYSLTETTPGALDEAGTIWRSPRDGSQRAIALIADEPGLNTLAVDVKEVFWTRWSEGSGDGSVLRLAK